MYTADSFHDGRPGQPQTRRTGTCTQDFSENPLDRKTDFEELEICTLLRQKLDVNSWTFPTGALLPPLVLCIGP